MNMKNLSIHSLLLMMLLAVQACGNDSSKDSSTQEETQTKKQSTQKPTQTLHESCPVQGNITVKNQRKVPIAVSSSASFKGALVMVPAGKSCQMNLSDQDQTDPGQIVMLYWAEYPDQSIPKQPQGKRAFLSSKQGTWNISSNEGWFYIKNISDDILIMVKDSPDGQNVGVIDRRASDPSKRQLEGIQMAMPSVPFKLYFIPDGKTKPVYPVQGQEVLLNANEKDAQQNPIIAGQPTAVMFLKNTSKQLIQVKAKVIFNQREYLSDFLKDENNNGSTSLNPQSIGKFRFDLKNLKDDVQFVVDQTDETTKETRTYTVGYDDSLNRFLFDGSQFGLELGKPEAPLVKRTASTTLQITWKKNTFASQYKLYRRQGASGSFAEIYTGSQNSFTDTKTQHGQTYQYKLQACDSVCSDFSTVKSGKTPPSKPTISRVESVSSTSLKISWTHQSGFSYKLFRSLSQHGNYTELSGVSGSTYTDTGLTANTTYYYKLQACDSVCSDFSTVKSGKTPPSKPTISRVESVSSTSLKIFWTHQRGFTYKLFRSLSQHGNYTELSGVSGSTYTDTGLTANTTYYYKLQACQNSVCSDFSTVKSGKTPPSKPTISRVESVSSTSLKISWTHQSGFTYKLFRATSQHGNYTELSGVSGFTYTDTGLTANTTYYYKLQACKGNVCSDLSSVKSGRTKITTPTISRVESVSSTSLKISWTHQSVFTYKLQRATTSQSYTELSGVSGSPHTDLGLTANTIYSYKLQACQNSVCSDFSTVKSGKTKPSWKQESQDFVWLDRDEHTSVVFKNKIWVLGGDDGDDVWSSSDGKTWTQETDDAGWSGREGHTSVVFKNKIWVLGGDDGSGKNDVWSSSDGKTWTEETDDAGWSGREGHTSVVFKNKIWVLGGDDGSDKNDVWSSSDGKTWTQETNSAGWSGREGHTSVVFKDKIWVLGGYYNDVWSSSDGKTWTQETAAAGWWLWRYSHTSVVFDKKIWVLGGSGKNDVWSSSDGTNWTRETAAAGWSGRVEHTSVVFNNKIWVLGGFAESNFKNDVWSFEP